MWIQGLPEMNVQNVTLKNVDIAAKQGGMIIDTDQLSFSDVNVEVEKGPALFMKNVHNLDFDDTQIGFEKSGELGLKIIGPFTEKLNLSGTTFQNVEKSMELGPNVEEQQITKPRN